jgi:hypothetical protein
MPARTLKAIPDLVAHVPVDHFDIVDGPRSERCMHVMDALNHGVEYVDQLFTLKTLASNSSFQRKLKLASVFCVLEDGSFNFTAVFCNRVISGIYEPKTRTGYFSLD